MIQIILEGLMLGLSAGVYCMGSCLVFFVPYLLAESLPAGGAVTGAQKTLGGIKRVSSFMLGRFIAYIAFALIIGFMGSAYKNALSARFSALALIAASLLMLFYSLTNSLKSSGSCAGVIGRFKFTRIPFALGMLTGLNPCPPFLVGAARLWTLGDISGGVILFIAFFLGTSVYMVPLVFVSFLGRGERIKQIGLMVALLSGIWFLCVGILALVR